MNQQKNTTPGEDTIHSQMIKTKLPPETLKYLLDMYNKILEEGEITKNLEKRHNNTLAERGKRPKRC